jgi:hypothetical protein
MLEDSSNGKFHKFNKVDTISRPKAQEQETMMGPLFCFCLHWTGLLEYSLNQVEYPTALNPDRARTTR